MGFIVQRYLDVGALRGFIEPLGVLAPLMFIALFALLSMIIVFFVPIVFLIGLGSVIFGKIYGAFYSWLGLTAGACLAFLAARYWVSDFAARFKQGKLKRIDELVSSNGFLSIIGLRLVLFGHPALNLVTGLTAMSLKEYVLGTSIGLIPRTFILSYIFESLQEPNSLRALLTSPYLLLLPVLALSRVGGVLLLIFLSKNYSKAMGLGKRSAAGSTR